MKSIKNGFTLIELLVVIAIIAILAAILFPVFAQAKLSAKKTASLAQLKQIGTASHMYASDYDDRFPSVYDGDNGGGDPIVTLYPYTKNGKMWIVNRENIGYFNNIDDYDRPDFGYNWGFEIRSAEAMISGELCTDGGPVVGCRGRGFGRYNSGKSITEMAEPAKLFAFGDTYDTPRATIGGDGWILDEFPGSKKNSTLRYNGRLNMAYADSHAGGVPFKAGDWAGIGRKGRAASPKNFEQRVNGYCANPDGLIRPFPRSGYPLGTMTCRDFVAVPEATGVIWWND